MWFWRSSVYKTPKEKYTEFIIANHILKMLACFCNSNKSRPHEIDYLSIITERKARSFVSSLYPYMVFVQENAKYRISTGSIYHVTLVFETVIYLCKLTLSSSSLQGIVKASFISALASFVSSLISSRHRWTKASVQAEQALSLSFSYQRLKTRGFLAGTI